MTLDFCDLHLLCRIKITFFPHKLRRYLRNVTPIAGLHKWNKYNRTSEQNALNIFSHAIEFNRISIERAKSKLYWMYNRTEQKKTKQSKAKQVLIEKKIQSSLESVATVLFAYIAKVCSTAEGQLLANSICGKCRVPISIQSYFAF